jgi:STIP1 family protein 1
MQRGGNQGNQRDQNNNPGRRFTTRIHIPISGNIPGNNLNSNNPHPLRNLQFHLSIVPTQNNGRIQRLLIPLSTLTPSNGVVSRFDEIVPHQGLFSKDLEPKIVNQFHDLGVSHFAKKEYYLALKNFKKAFEKDKNSIFLANMAVCYKKVSAWNEALDMINKVISIDPKECYYRFAGNVHFNLAKIGSDFDHQLSALDFFRDAFELNQSVKNVHNYLLLRKINFFRRIDSKIAEKNELLDYLNSGWNKPRKLQTKEYLKRKNIVKNGSKFLKIIDVNEMDDHETSLPDYCTDVISMEPFKMPVVTPSGNSFEKSHLQEHCRISGYFDPISRKKFQNMSKVYPNKNLQKLILDLYLKSPWKFEVDIDLIEDPIAWKFSEIF